MIKLSDFIAEFLYQYGLREVFMLTGGGAMHLNDSFGKHTGFNKVCNHHEQASAMAAESYARLTGNIPIVNVTTGPGGINTLNGVFGAWVDSIPMLVVSGQVKYETTLDSTDLPLRQLGDQECDVISMVKDITKYAVMVTKPEDILYHLEKALYLAKTGRPGPVWVDIPMNIQGAMIDPGKLKKFDPQVEQSSSSQVSELLNSARLEKAPEISAEIITDILERLSNAKRPVIMVGAGIRLSGQHAVFMELIEVLNIPVVTGWNAHDALHDGHDCHAGKPGTIGDRAGNFTVQNADVLLVLGSRLNIRQVSYNWASFAKYAYKIMVDIDLAELQKPTLSLDQAIHADLKDFLPNLLSAVKNMGYSKQSGQADWLAWCKQRKIKYPTVLPEYWGLAQKVNPYCFMQKLSDHLTEDQIIVSGNGTACVVAFQAMRLKQGQRLYTNSGCASMGYDLPGAIGAAVAAPGKDIVCLAGDGSIMQNLQELAAIVFNHYPIKIFLLNNNGYHSIRQTQNNFFGEPLIGVGPESGLGFPDFEKIVTAFGLPYVQCDSHSGLDVAIEKTLKISGPAVCEVILDLQQQFSPKLSSRRLEDGTMVSPSLEDMAPFLDREEFSENILVEQDEN